MNIENIAATLRRIEETDESHFDMRTYFNSGHCGTPACIGGFAMAEKLDLDLKEPLVILQNEARVEEYRDGVGIDINNVFDTAREFLGLTEDQAAQLFYYTIMDPPPTRSEAVLLLSTMVETGRFHTWEDLWPDNSARDMSQWDLSR